MTDYKPIPVDRERTFNADELFFSRTDRKGVINAGNEVFVRISGWSEAELIGAPHNIIRHPDNPRAAFELLWNYLLAGRPVAAYVKNMAKDGTYYWVLATVVPQGDGFLSVRIKPSGPHFEAVQAVYEAVLATERSLEADGVPRKEVVAASLAQMVELIQAAGFPDYDAFMHVALPTELGLRQQAMTGAMPESPDAQALARSGRHLDTLFEGVDRYLQTQATLSTGLESVRDFAEDIRLGAMNALLAAAQLEDRASSLGAVADLMGASARDVAREVEGLGGEIAPLIRMINGLVFPVSLAKVQMDMARFFAAELSETGDGATPAHRREDLSRMLDLLCAEVDGLASLQEKLAAELKPLGSRLTLLDNQLRVLGSLDIAGRLEVGRVSGANRVVTMFDEIRHHLEHATTRLTAMRGAIDHPRSSVTDEELLAEMEAAATAARAPERSAG